MGRKGFTSYSGSMALYTKFVPAGHGGTLAPPCEFILFHLLGVDSGGDTGSGN